MKSKLIIERNHYIKGVQVYDRVTAILDNIRKPGLEKLIEIKGRAYVDDIMRKAGERGTQFHSWAEAFAKNKLSEPKLLGIKSSDADMYNMVISFTA